MSSDIDMLIQPAEHGESSRSVKCSRNRLRARRAAHHIGTPRSTPTIIAPLTGQAPRGELM
jgi:hypothetical protein